MYFRLIKNDIKKSKFITFITFLFVVCSAVLMSLATILTVQLSGSIDTLMKQAKSPHFLQMHQGSINQERLIDFAEHNEFVEDFQVLEFVNIEGSQIQLGETSLADTVQDNGLCVQSDTFDYLVDLEGEVIEPAEGELYVPLCYMKNGTTKVGDSASILGRKMIVAGFLRDSQMNSELASSKRFLVHKDDFEAIKAGGNTEYLIEFRLKDLKDIGAFETAYNAAGLECNGPTITHSLFKIMNAISDGLMIAVIILISILVVIVALLCIRFTLLAKIEENYVEIGTMKAIGIRVRDIKKIYLAKYGVIAAVGCLVGIVLSNCYKGILTDNIKLYFGESENTLWSYIISVFGVFLIFLLIMAYINGILKSFKTLSSADAIRFGSVQEKQKSTMFFRLSHKKILSTNTFLGIKDILMRKKLYLTMLIVIVISTFILIVPRNIYHTITADEFSGYMGVGTCDVLMDIQQIENIEMHAMEVCKVLEQDPEVRAYEVLTTKTFETILKDGTKERLKVALGNHQTFPVQYVEGHVPTLKNEMALSAINASDLEKKVGDTMTLIIAGKEEVFEVCGIYSDITNGGKTAKATFNTNQAETMWSDIYITYTNPDLASEKAEMLKEQFSFAKALSIKEYIAHIFGRTMTSVQKASDVALVISILMSFLITLLFIKMLMAKDAGYIAILKSLGFNNKNLRKQYMVRSGCIVGVAVIMGVLIANTLGEALAGILISSLGAASFELAISPLETYLLCPFLMIVPVVLATLIGTASMKKIKISENIRE
ncbi:MAG: ABC transporter permease [Cellulosilyticum sp.]|nr:ABC transporter permease [Cellulosilyticum sp.]